jgi:p-methyltransferase
MSVEPGLDLLLIDDESSFFHPKYLGKAPASWEDNFLSRQLTNAMLWGLMTPKMAVPLLSAHAKAAGHSVEAVYRPLLAWKMARFRRLLRRGPRVVGITTVAIFDGAYLARIVGEVRRLSPGSVVVLGGQGAADYPEVRTLGDLYISGHGEQALADLVSALKGGAELDRVPGVSSLPGGGRTIAGSLRYEGITRPLFPDWSVTSTGCRWYPVEASRGCRYNCAYCIFPGRTAQEFRAPEDVAAEMRHVHETRGIRKFDFLDSSLTSDTGFVLRLCAAIRREKLKVKWKCWARPDAFAREPELAAKMAEAGCRRVFLGVESIHENILSKMRRPMSREVIERGLGRVFGSGIRVNGLFVIGFPGETEATVAETTQFIRERPFTDVYLGVFCMSREMRDLAAAEPERYLHLAGEPTKGWRHDGMDYKTACALTARMTDSINRGRFLRVATTVEDVLRV